MRMIRYLKLSSIALLSFLSFSSVTFAQTENTCLTSQSDINEEFMGTLVDNDKDGTLAATLVKKREDGNQKKNLIEYYCDTWLHTHSSSSEIPNMNNRCVDTGKMRFDPRQSLFMYGLCVGYDEAHKGKEGIVKGEKVDYAYRERKEIFKNLSYTSAVDIKGNIKPTISEDITKYIPVDSDGENLIYDRRGLDKNNDICQPETGMSSCMMGYPTTNILTTVFAGLFDIKKAAIDGYNHGTDKDSIDLSIKDFSIALFDQIGPSTTNDTSVCNSSVKQFIMEQDSGSNEKQSHCGHLRTRGEVESMIKGAIKDVDRVKELDGHAIAEAKCEGLKENLIPCAMSNTENVTKDKDDSIFASEESAWRNVLLNELFFARLWIDYYTMIIETEPTRQTLEGGSLSDKNLRIKMEIQTMYDEFTMIENSVDRMVNLLAQYRTMYHQCISLKAYQEDLVYYRTRLNKMYTPLHQLKYTTDDAQEQESS